MNNTFISSLKSKLKNGKTRTTDTAMVGFDGYVDYIQKVVKSVDSTTRSYFGDITQLADHISAAAGKSAQFELRTQTIKMGGNAPIMSQALASLSIKNSCVGMLGTPDVHSVFKSMDANCTHISLGSPATTNALEFEDGKLILSEVSAFDELDWEHIVRVKEDERVLACMQDSKLIAMVDWSNLPKCSILWKDVYEILKAHQWTDKLFFFDLCDPSKKSHAAIQDILDIISSFSTIGRTVLGLNENEALKVHKVLFADSSSHDMNMTEVAKDLFAKLSIDNVLIHPIDRCLLVTKDKHIEMVGHIVSNPKILTGGGDNFNAGFCFGLLHQFTEEECLLSAMATSGAYVQQGYSPNKDQLINYLDNFRNFD